MNSTLLVSSVPEYIQKIIEFPNFKFARGEPKKYEKPFLPGIWRPDNSHIDRTPINDSSEFSKGELEILEKFQQKVLSGEVFDPYFNTFIGNIEAKIDICSESLWHWASLAQHYGEPTRLVDVTSDCLAALYFACEKYDDEPGFVHVFQHNFNEVNRNNLALVKFGKTYFDLMTIKECIDDKYPFTPTSDTTAVISPSFPNRRVEAQKGCFCFTRAIGMQAYWGGQLTFEVNNKANIRTELQRLGYTHETIYPKEFNKA